MSDDLTNRTLDEHEMVQAVVARLEPRFAGSVLPETLERLVHDSLDRLLPTAKVATYLPVLAEKSARKQLATIGRWSDGTP